MVAKSAITAVVVVASRRANHRRVAERSAHAAMCNAAGAAVLITSLRRIRGRIPLPLPVPAAVPKEGEFF